MSKEIEIAVKQYIRLITTGQVELANDMKNAIIETETNVARF